MEEADGPRFLSSRRSDLLLQEMDQELLIYDLKRHKAYCLNRTAALIWKHCDGANSSEDLRRLLEKDLQTTVPPEAVRLGLVRLASLGLLNNGTERRRPGPSRREALVKAGKAAAWLLPVVTAMVAPTPAAAATRCPARTGQSCTLFGCTDGQSCGSRGTRTCTNGTCH